MLLLYAFSLQLNFSSAQVQTARPSTTISTNGHGFYEYLPQGYSTGSQTYPLIVFVHGTGEIGDGSAASLPLVLHNGPPKLISQGVFPVSFTVNGLSYKFIVISPQFTTWPTQTDILEVMNYALSHYRVDKTRVYLTGLSMGGGAVWDFASSTSTPTNAQMLAAIVPISGASSPTMGKATQLVKYQMPVWAFHNQNDPTVTVQNTIGFVNDINTARNTAITNKLNPGPAPKMTIFPVSGHDAWTKAYDINYTENNLNVYQWMLTYTRSGSTSNSAPIASAGADKSITLPTNSVALAGTGSDIDGSVKSYAWSKTAGPTQFTISNAAVSNPTISNLVAGTYTFRLTVTDNLGATGFDDMNIVVNAAAVNKIPVVSAGADQTITLPTSSVTLAGSATDPDGTIKTYAWSKTAGPTQFTISNTAIANPVVSGLVAGTYTFRLTATDNSGATAFDDINIVVNAAAVNKIPVVSAGPDQTVTLPTSSVTLAGSATDPDGTIKTYVWSKPAGPSQFTISSTSIANPVISAMVAGTYTFRLTATDNSGATASDDMNIIVNPAATTTSNGTINVNIYSGANPVTDAQWNNWSISSGVATNITSSPLKYSTGSASTVVANLSQSTAVSDNDLGYPMSGSTMAPAGVLRYTSYSSVGRTLTLSGLSTSGTYSLYLYCSRNNKPGNSTIIKTGSQTQTINTNKNFTNDASFTNLVPDAQGKITLNISQSGEFNYINGFTLSGTSSSSLAAAVAVQPIATKYVKINVYSGTNPYSASDWNNWNVGGGSVSNVLIPALKYSDGTASTMTATLSQSTAVSDNGIGYPVSGASMAPKQVLEYTSYATAKRTLTLGGLSTSRKYDIELYASRNNNSGNSTIFSINTLSTSIITYQNFTNKAVFTGITPDAQGRITINIAPGSTYSYLNGFVVTDGSSTSTAAVNSTGALTTGTLVATAEDAVFNNGEDNQAALKIVPNPVHDHFTLDLVNSEIGNMQVQVVSINGAVVKSLTIAKNQSHITQTISIGSLPQGTYIVHVQIKNWSGMVKILKL